MPLIDLLKDYTDYVIFGVLALIANNLTGFVIE